MKKILLKSVIAFSYFLFFSQNLNAQQWEPNVATKDILSSDYQVFGVSVVDSNIIWAVASLFTYSDKTADVKLLKTIDGGKNWTVSTIYELGNHASYSIKAFDSNTAWINASSGGGVFKTVDGGKTWDKNLKSYYSGRYLHFFDKLNAFSRNFGNYSYTTDGGDSWTNKNINFENQESVGQLSIATENFSLGDTSWFGTNSGRVFRSTDRGKNWLPFAIAKNRTYLHITSISFIDSKNGLLVCSSADSVAGIYYGIAQTSDGGENWKFIPKENLPYYTRSVYFPAINAIPRSKKFVLEYYNNVEGASNYLTSDNGNTWKFLSDTGWAFGNVEFQNVNTGWLGCTTYRSSYLMYKWNPNKVTTPTTNISSNTSIKILPNPNDGSFIIDCSLTNNFSPQALQIIDVMGKVVYRKENLNSADVIQKIDLINIPNGMYIVQLSSEQKIVTSRLIISK